MSPSPPCPRAASRLCPQSAGHALCLLHLPLTERSAFAPGCSQAALPFAGSPNGEWGKHVEAWGRHPELLSASCFLVPASQPLCWGTAWNPRLVWGGEVDPCRTPLWPPGSDPASLPCSLLRQAPARAASHPSALMECRQALGCSLSVPVAGAEPRWNVGGLCGLGLPTLPKLSTSS